MKKKEARVAAKKKKAPAKKAAKKSAPKAKKAVKKAAPKAAAKAKSKKTAPKSKSAAAKKAAPKKSAKPAKKVSKAKTAPKKAAKSSAPVAKKTVSTAKSAPKKTEKKAPADLQSFLTPLDDRLLVRLNGAEKMTSGGLYIPDTVSDVSGNLRGQVVSVGRGHRDDKGRIRPMDVTLGDQVIFAEFSGSKIKVQNEDLIILREAEVMGIVSK